MPDVLDTLTDAELLQLYYERDGEAWVRHYFPDRFTRPFTFYQDDFWEWGWQIEPDTYYRPRVECEPRGVGKSTNAEAWVASLIARKKREMIGYVSLEDDKATKHFDTIKAMLETDALVSVYPHCKPQVQKLRNVAAQWSRDAIVTESGAMVVPLSLLGSSRGWKSPVGKRFDVIVLDDIDKLGLSVDFIKKLLELLKGEILAAGDDNTVVLMPQNLIHRDSICTQIHDHRADILSERDFRGPYPLLKWYDAEKRSLPDGAKTWKITAGEAFDPAIDIEYAQKLLNKFGKATFDRECQQEVHKVEDDKDFREWDETRHVITRSEMAAVFAKVGVQLYDALGRFRIPHRWNVGMGFDWGTTPGHPSAVAFVARPDETTPFSDSHFVFAEAVLPRFPRDAHEEAEVVSPGRVAREVRRVLSEFGVLDGQVKEALMSHEASAARNTLLQDLPEELTLFFEKWKAAVGSGVPQIQNLLELDAGKAHPFRRHPVTGESLRGRPRLYFVVEDGQGELFADGDGRVRVRGAANAAGLARARYEMPLYSFRNQGQKKTDDDFVDGFRGLMARFGVAAGELTEAERQTRKLPEELQPAAVFDAIGTAAFPELVSAASHARRQIEKREEKEDTASQKAWERFTGRPVTRGGRKR